MAELVSRVVWQSASVEVVGCGIWLSWAVCWCSSNVNAAALNDCAVHHTQRQGRRGKPAHPA
jgi:hypothetical protein